MCSITPKSVKNVFISDTSTKFREKIKNYFALSDLIFILNFEFLIEKITFITKFYKMFIICGDL